MSEDAHSSDSPSPPSPKPQYIDIGELSNYRVGWSEDPDTYGWGIWAIDGTHVFSAGGKDTSDAINAGIKTFLDYWCFHLNMAYALGHTNARGLTVVMTAGTRAHFDELYRRYLGAASS
jgi:hypothetical protein